jgi:hypothetical protein
MRIVISYIDAGRSREELLAEFDGLAEDVTVFTGDPSPAELVERVREADWTAPLLVRHANWSPGSASFPGTSSGARIAAGTDRVARPPRGPSPGDPAP